MWREEYGLVRPSDIDPLRFCREADFTYDQRLSCYYESAMHVNNKGTNDLSRLIPFAEAIKDDEMAKMAVDVMAAGVISNTITAADHTAYIHACQKAQERLRLICINGLSGGFMAYGEPQNEYKKAIPFCASEQLRADERDVCYRNIIRTFKGSYAREKVEAICATIDTPYRVHCSYDRGQSL
jgi:hypothetical protein